MKSESYPWIILLTLFLTVCQKTNAQSPDWLWAKAIGGTGLDFGISIAPDPVGSGDIYTTGYFEGTVDFDSGDGVFNLTSAGGTDIFISKFDGSGNFVWANAIGGVSNDFGRFVALDPAGNGDVYTIGNFQGTVDFDPDDGIFNLTSAGSFDIFISKFDGSGNFVWARAIGGTGSDAGSSIVLDPTGSGDFYTTGTFSGTVDFDPGDGIFNLTLSGGRDIFISKFDSSGNFVWAKAMGGTNTEEVASIAVDPAGGGAVYTTGHFWTTVDFDPGAENFNLTSEGDQDIFISKLDSSGNFVWAKAMGGTNNESGASIAVDPVGSGDVYIIGRFQGKVDFDPNAGTSNFSSAGSNDIFISKLDSSGNFVWAKAMGGTGVDNGQSIAVDLTGSGDLYTSGTFSGTVDFDPGVGTFNLTSDGDQDIFISKLDGSGNFVWAKAIGGTGDDYGQSIALDALGHVYVGGYFFSTSISLDSTTLTNADNTGNTADVFIAKLDAITSSVVDSKSHQIIIYPNPATHELTIEFDEGGLLNVEITLYNILGEVVFSSKDENIIRETTIDISALNTGICFIELNIDGNRVMTKVMKE